MLIRVRCGHPVTPLCQVQSRCESNKVLAFLSSTSPTSWYAGPDAAASNGLAV
jgi:hypothetical protein